MTQDLLQEGVHWTFSVYLKDPGMMILGEANPHTNASSEWDRIIQVNAKTHNEAVSKLPEEYKNWYVVKVEHPLDSFKSEPKIY